jgi:hypothetical protein
MLNKKDFKHFKFLILEDMFLCKKTRCDVRPAAVRIRINQVVR